MTSAAQQLVGEKRILISMNINQRIRRILLPSALALSTLSFSQTPTPDPHAVPVLERKAIARALFKAVKVGQNIPMALYQAVAEVLAFVYRLRA